MSVTLISGCPASGKSTLTKKLVETTGAVILNRDSAGGTIADLLPKLDALLQDKKSVVLDNLYPTIDSRKPFIEMCQKHQTSISCQVMGTTIEDAIFNAVQRAIGLIGKFPTPEAIKEAKHPNIFPPAVLFKFKKEFQKPTVAEGFDKVETIPFVRQTDSTFVNKALFIDYDGTLRECINGNDKYPVIESQVEIKSNRTEVLKKYQSNGYLLLGISNQSGVHKKELTDQKAHELFQHTNKLLGVEIDYRFCPHQSAPISCYCRKPSVGVIVEFMLKYKLDLKQCYFIGDMTTDETCSKRAGVPYMDQTEFFKM